MLDRFGLLSVYASACECFVVAAFPRVLFTSKGTAVPWTGLACWQSISPTHMCVCVCHFEGGNLTVIKVKRPTVLVRGRGEE